MDKQSIAGAFGANLRVVRQDALVTQEALSHLSGLHRTEIGLLERGKRMPRLDTILRLAGALATDPGELLRGIYVQIPGRIDMPASTPVRTDEEASIEVGLMALVLDLHPEHLTVEELIRRACATDTRFPDERGALGRGLDRLRRAELVREKDGLIEPTVAALHFDRLPF
jgi:transcriptional regulator with XRE-family HTH domain